MTPTAEFNWLTLIVGISCIIVGSLGLKEDTKKSLFLLVGFGFPLTFLGLLRLGYF